MAISYYFKHYKEIRSELLNLNYKNALSVNEVQQPKIEGNLAYIHSNFRFIHYT